MSLVRKLICPRTSRDTPSWKPLGSLAVTRMFLLLPIPVARWTWRQGTPKGNLGVTVVLGMELWTCSCGAALPSTELG